MNTICRLFGHKSVGGSGLRHYYYAPYFMGFLYGAKRALNGNEMSEWMKKHPRKAREPYAVAILQTCKRCGKEY